eukprot:10018754-Alexandrium_andersonii.AAC.1
MSASLVGSEMCIRDSILHCRTLPPGQPQERVCLPRGKIVAGLALREHCVHTSVCICMRLCGVRVCVNVRARAFLRPTARHLAGSRPLSQ